MAALTVKEQVLIHALKALTHGTIEEGPGPSLPPPVSSGATGAKSTGEVEAGNAPRCVRPYTDPEQIEFAPSKSPRRRPVYALVWTWRQHRICKTKARAIRSTRAWKKWYERQGWKVSSHQGGYFAARGNERHTITLHEYDRETNRRLN